MPLEVCLGGRKNLTWVPAKRSGGKVHVPVRAPRVGRRCTRRQKSSSSPLPNYPCQCSTKPVRRRSPKPPSADLAECPEPPASLYRLPEGRLGSSDLAPARANISIRGLSRRRARRD